MVMLAVSGVTLPMRAIAYADPGFLLDYRGVVLALIVIFGYMLTDLGHYGYSSGRNTELDPRSFFLRVRCWWSSRWSWSGISSDRPLERNPDDAKW
jgi:hypothetical protein